MRTIYSRIAELCVEVLKSEAEEIDKIIKTLEKDYDVEKIDESFTPWKKDEYLCQKLYLLNL